MTDGHCQCCRNRPTPFRAKYDRDKHPDRSLDFGRVYASPQTSAPREAAFAHVWESWATPSPGINGGRGILCALMADRRRVSFHDQIFGWYRQRLRIGYRERKIVATVVQWLGTNVGWSFLTEALDLCGYTLVPKEGAERARAGRR